MKFSKLFYVLALLSALVAIGLAIAGNKAETGPAVIFLFIALAIAFQGSEKLKGFSYTMVVLSAVSMAMYYPALFKKWGDFDVSVLVVPLIQLIMFGMGTSMSFRDFLGVAKSPTGVVIGVVSHFIIMPLLGFTLAYFSGFEPEIAAGIILIGCSPNGMASNVIAYLAKANVALSITITAVSTSLAPFVTPFLMKFLAGELIEINVWHMMMEIMKMVIFPIAAGLLFNHFFSGKFKWLDKAMPYVSMFGIAFSIVVIAASGRDNLLSIGPLLLLIVLIHNITGYFLGYWSARLFKMKERDCRTVAIEVGMQNGGLATGIAKSLGKLATLGLAAGVFGPLMNVTGSILASWWHKKTPKDEVES
ncbi:MAG: bile acid:sodium symporter family protein [Chitinophagaceae bacterium]|nr:bile acid:sodium symporter family protein [Chitinophagaceae bacterium]